MDPCSKLLHRRSLPVRRTWHVEYSGYYPLLFEFLGRRPFSPAVVLDLLVILWGMMLGGIPYAYLWSPLSVFVLPFGIGPVASSPIAWPCMAGEWRGKAERLYLGYDV